MDERVVALESGCRFMLVALLIAGSVSLILFGTRFLRKGLDRFFGERLNLLIAKLAKGRFRCFFAGLIVSACSPSSTTISLLTVQSVKEGHLTSSRAFALSLGANIGLTTPALLLGLSIDAYAPIMLLVGVLLFQFTRSSNSRGIGQIILSLGLIFLAVHLIRNDVSGFVSDAGPEDDFVKFIEIAKRHPLWMMAIAAVITVLLQSSTATIGLIIGLMAGGVDSLAIAFPAILGTNVGLGLTMLLVGWKQVDSRQMAISNLMLKVAAVAGLLYFQHDIIAWLDAAPGTITQHITYAHAGYNILVAIVGLPLITPIDTLASKAIPAATRQQQEVFGPRYIQDKPVDSASLGLGQSQREIIRVSEIVRQMLDELWQGLKNNDDALVRDIAKRDDQVDLLDSKIKQYLSRLARDIDEIANSREQINQFTYLTELETIGDIIDKNLCELVLKKIRLRVNFTPQGWKELDDFYHKVAQNLLIADTAFVTRDKSLARQLLRHKNFLSNYERKLRDQHFARLNTHMEDAHETSAIHLDILTALKRINSCVSHVGYAILGDDLQPPEDARRSPDPETMTHESAHEGDAKRD